MSDDSLESMLADGSMVYAGESETGEPLYTIDQEKCRILHPTVWMRQYDQFLNNVYELWQLGFLDVQFLEDDLRVDINSQTFSDRSGLEPELQYVLSEIVAAIQRAQ